MNDDLSSPEPPYPFQQLLGYAITEWAADHARAELDLGPQHTNRHGIPHGGIYGVLLDTVAGFAGCWRPEKEPPVYAMTLSLTINFVGLPRGKKLIATGKRIGGGRNLFFAEADIRDELGTLVATASGTHRYRQGKGNPVGSGGSGQP